MGSFYNTSPRAGWPTGGQMGKFDLAYSVSTADVRAPLTAACRSRPAPG